VGHSQVIVAGCLLFALVHPSAGDEANEWNELPYEWSGAVDYAAFCKPGEWTFLPVGEDLARCDYVSCPSQVVSVDRVFFKLRGVFHGARWPSPGPQVDELTVLKIMRSEAGEIAIQAFAGDVLAAWQDFPVKIGILFIERPTECEPGRAWRFLSDAADLGNEYVSLALAADGSLLVRVEVNTWGFFPLKENTMRFYARFPAAPVPGEPPRPAD
jgi:hypothetical protein